MKTVLTPGRAVGLALALLGVLPSHSRAASPTLAITPSTVSNLYAANVTLQITGLTNSETVLIERFLDLNGNGTIDSGEPLVQSFRLTDGQVTSVAGVRNGNIPGDDPLLVDGQISSSLSFAYGPEFSRGSGTQLLRLSSPSGRFSAIQQSLTVTQSAYAQQITGTVSNGVSALPYALVGALMQIGQDSKFITGAIADNAGHFSLSVSNGTYEVIAFSPGYIGNFATSPLVTVSGASTNVTVQLSPATATVSGTVTETVSGLGIPGQQFFITSTNNEYAVMFSDSSGAFSVSLVTGQWKLDSSDYSLMAGGYLRPANKTKINVTGTMSGVSLQYTKGTALIYGAVKDDLNNPLPGVRLSSGDNGNLYQSSDYSGSNGNYFVAAAGGSWSVGPDSSNAGLPAGYNLQQVQVTISDGQAVQTNLIARRATAQLVGQAMDGNGNPLGSVNMFAFGTNGANVGVQTGGDGSFDVPVYGGTWTLSMDTQAAASRNLVAPQLSFNVTDGNSISNINYVASLATRSISGSVKTSTNTAISGLNVFANAFINGTNYNANATTDGSGNYSIPVLSSLWNVGLDTQGLAQRGYGIVFSQNADTTASNQTVNFVVGTPPVGSMLFRQSYGAVGEFAGSRTPTVSYPVVPKNYRVLFRVFNETNPPTANTILFTGPPGSGMTNMQGDTTFGAAPSGNDVVYLSLPSHNPSAAMGGNWTVTYRGNPNNFNMPDPQVGLRTVVPLPTITVSNDLLKSVTWSYKDQNGNPLAGIPSFIQTNRVDLIDQNANLVDAELVPAALSYSYPATNLYHWSSINVLRINYYDDLTNQYFIGFSENAPTLSGASRLSGQRFQFLLNGPAGQNFTIQYSTNLNLSNWSSLFVTNNAVSPFSVIDPGATNPFRFYRVLVGP